jgi:membrane-associated phospholipid phosphatase
VSSWTSARRTRLVAPRLRIPVVAVVVLAAASVAVLGWHFAGDTHAGPLDQSLAGEVDMRHGVARFLGQGFADLGNPLPVAVGLLALTVVAYVIRGPRGLALALLGPLLAMIATSLLLKPLIDRTRSGALAFPSGHTTAIGSMAVAAGTLLLGWRVVPRVLRWAGAGILALLVTAVGASMVGRGYHYPSDTVGAVGVALAVVLLVALVVDAVGDHAAAADHDHVAEGGTRGGRRTVHVPMAGGER